MELTEAARLFISKCFRDGQPISISPFFGESYQFENGMCKFTEDVLNEMLQSNRVKILSQNKKSVNIVGVKGCGSLN